MGHPPSENNTSGRTTSKGADDSILEEGILIFCTAYNGDEFVFLEFAKSRSSSLATI
jgi:hypothetical protein